MELAPGVDKDYAARGNADFQPVGLWIDFTPEVTVTWF